MASVRLTEQLRSNIMSKIRDAGRKYVSTLSFSDEDYLAFNDYLRDKVVGPEIERTDKMLQDYEEALMPVLAKHGHTGEKVIRIIATMQGNVAVTLNGHYSVSAVIAVATKQPEGDETEPTVIHQSLDRSRFEALSKKAYVLCKDYGGKVSNGRLEIPLDKEFPELAAKLIERKEAEQNMQSSIRDADSIVSECNTVKQLLEAWPEAKALLPEYVLDKMRERTASAPRQRKEISSASDSVKRMTGLAISLNALDR